MELHPQSFDVVGAVGPAGEIAEVELDLVPALVQSHGHGADEGLHPGGALVVGGAEPPPDVLIVENLHLECEVLLQVLNNHNEKRKLYAQSLVRVCGAADEGC